MKPRAVGSVDTVTVVAHDIGGVGGMERQLEALIAGLLERGVRVVAISRTLEIPSDPLLRWFRIPGPARPFVVAYPWFALVASVVAMRRRQGILQATGAIVLNHADVCSVHYLHNRLPLGVARVRRSTLLYRLHGVVAAALSRRCERLVYARRALSDRLVAVSEPLARELAAAFPDRAPDVRVIPNAVDARRFRPDPGARLRTRGELGLSDVDRLAVFIGSEWQGKGLHLALDALRRAGEWHLLVVGAGDAETLTRRASDQGVAGRVHLVGETSEPERYLAAADAFVLPSAYESFSLAALEAAANGVPVIATGVGIVTELAAAGGALLVERHPESIAGALRRLAEAPDEARRMGRRARAFARRFDWANAVESYLALYREVAAEARVAVSGPIAGVA